MSKKITIDMGQPAVAVRCTGLLEELEAALRHTEEAEMIACAEKDTVAHEVCSHHAKSLRGMIDWRRRHSSNKQISENQQMPNERK